MSEQPTIVTKRADLSERFPGWVVVDTRQGFQGYIVQADHLLEFAQTMRDEMATITFPLSPGWIICRKAKWKWFTMPIRPPVARLWCSRCRCPAKIRWCLRWSRSIPGAEFQEREAWDLRGSDLKAILTCAGF